MLLRSTLEGIMRVILMLRAHSMHGAVQAAGCAVLRSLAASDACKLEAAEAGGLQLVADALKLHLDYPPLALHACWALRNLAGIDGNRGRIAQTGANLPSRPRRESADLTPDHLPGLRSWRPASATLL